MKTWHFCAIFEPLHWAVPLFIDVCPWWAIDIAVLCFEFQFRYYAEQEPSPEEELRQLNEYADEQLKWIAEERAEIMAKMGVSTSA